MQDNPHPPPLLSSRRRRKKSRHEHQQQRDDDHQTSSNNSNNPLSYARGKSKSHSNILFKRFGHGIQLFVQYYAGQPRGTVSADDDDFNNTTTTTKTTTTVEMDLATTTTTTTTCSAPNRTGGAGLSRAAKRRKKKKKQPQQKSTAMATNHNTRNTNEARPVVVAPNNRKKENDHDDDHDVSSHPIVQAAMEHVLRVGSKKREETTTCKPQQQGRTLLALRHFFESMARPLPVTFRLRRSLSPSQIQSLQQQIQQLQEDDNNANKNMIQPLPFGDGYLYQISSCSKANLRQQFPSLHQFLLQGSRNGSLARQELGSMLPVLALEQLHCFDTTATTTTMKKKQKRLRILDMCASPGSKTLQALELLLVPPPPIITTGSSSREQQDSENTTTTTTTTTHNTKDQNNPFRTISHPSSTPCRSSKGRILANDVSESRLRALREAIQRSGVVTTMPLLSPMSSSSSSSTTSTNTTKSIIGYSCQDARHLSINNNNTSSSSTINKKQLLLSWDMVLCDVPCSGDGTIRKDPHILQGWKPEQGHLLHPLQVQILIRALELIQVGGTVCYSTCSLNPIENEAVVAAALLSFSSSRQQQNNSKKYRTGPAAVELVEFPILPGFHRRPGLSSWRVADYQMDDVVSTSRTPPPGQRQRQWVEDRDDDDESNDKEENGGGGGGNGVTTNNGSYSGGEKNDDDDDETPELRWYDAYEDARHAKMPNAVKTMWPPSTSITTTTSSHPSSSCDGLNLDRCTRLWPQDHDSGGFFLALLRRNW